MIQPDLTLLAFLSLLLCILLTIRSIAFRKQASKSQQELQSTLKSLSVANSKIELLKNLEKRFSDYEAELHTAEITTKIQTSRLAAADSLKSVNIPERYRYIRGFSEKGIPPSDIASILTISNNEAEQLLNLASLSRHS